MYLLDTNVLSDLTVNHPQVWVKLEQHLMDSQILWVCSPVYYEILRGLRWKNAKNKQKILENKILVNLEWLSVEDEDWLQASEFWANAVKQGRQLSDIDFLLAAMVYRRNAVLVSSDNDFNILPIKRENWRET